MRKQGLVFLLFSSILLAVAMSAQSQDPVPPAPQVAPEAKDKQANTEDKACEDFSISPGMTRLAPTGTVTFTAAPQKGCTLPDDLSWVVDPDWNDAKMAHLRQQGNSADLTLGPPESIRKKIHEDPTQRYFNITASSSTNKTRATTRVVITLEPAGDIVIPVIGFEQAGASAAQSAQKFFFNFFISRPLPSFKKDHGTHGSGETNGADSDIDENGNLFDRSQFGSRWQWWGAVRIASYPQQISSGVGEFAVSFATQVAELKVNEIAQSGEFTTGLAYRIKEGKGLYPIGSDRGLQRSVFSVVAGFGAISPLSPTTSQSVQLVVTPPPGSPQRDLFLSEFPSSANSTYTGFTTPDRRQFYWEYGAGIRLTNLFFDETGLQSGSPAMVTYSLGQNQAVTGGLSQGFVQRIEGFFPLHLGDRFDKNVTTLYLFGRVDMRLAHLKQTTPLVLQPAPPTVNPYDNDVNIIAVPSNRDLYTIGVGVDAVKLIKSIASISSPSKTSKSTSSSQ